MFKSIKHWIVIRSVSSSTFTISTYLYHKTSLLKRRQLSVRKGKLWLLLLVVLNCCGCCDYHGYFHFVDSFSEEFGWCVLEPFLEIVVLGNSAASASSFSITSSFSINLTKARFISSTVNSWYKKSQGKTKFWGFRGWFQPSNLQHRYYSLCILAACTSKTLWNGPSSVWVHYVYVGTNNRYVYVCVLVLSGVRLEIGE